jgi:hypothetical protein
MAGVPTGTDKATFLQVTQEAVDRARVDRILLKAEGLQAVHKLVSMALLAVYEQQQARFQEAMNVPGTGFRSIPISPTTTTIRHKSPPLSDALYMQVADRC